MKRVVSLLLVVAMCLLCGCTKPADDNYESTQSEDSSVILDTTDRETELDTPEVDPDELLKEYLANVDNYKSPARNFGEPASNIYMDETLIVGMLYPKTGIPSLDEAISDWMDGVVTEYKNEIASEEHSDVAELNATCESYMIGDSIVGIKMSGSFISSYVAHPIDIVKTFNFDVKASKFVELSDVFGENGIKTFRDKLISEAKVESDDADEHILDNFLLTDRGVEITLNRGDYLAMAEGTKSYFFEYPEIRELLRDSFVGKPKEEEKEEDTADTTEDKPEDITPVVPDDGAQQKIDPSKPMVALTFDDGPSTHTDRLLDIFKKNGGKGTFFVVGYMIEGKEDTLKRIAKEGHEIGNHSWNHKQLTTLDEQGITDQIMKTRAKIYEATGIDCHIMRPPYGAFNDAVKAVAAKLGVPFINWSVDTVDWKTKNADAVYNEVMKNVKDGSIILCHDLHKTTVDAMERVIPKLIEEGYQLVTVSELLSYTNEELEAGKVYYKQ